MLRPLDPPASRVRPGRQAAAQLVSEGSSSALLRKRGGMDAGADPTFLLGYNDWQAWARRFARQVTAASFNAQVIADLCARCDVLVEHRTAGEWAPAEQPQFGPALIEAYANPLQGPDELLRLHAWHYQVAGEMVGTQLDGSFGVEYGIYSVASVEWDKPDEDSCTIRLVPDGKVEKLTAFVVPREQVVRYWQPDHEWQSYAWSPMAASIDDLKRYRALAKYALKTADSAVAMAGLLWAPGEAFTVPAAGGDPEDAAGAIDAGTATSALEELYYQVAALRSSASDDITSVAPPLFHWDKDLGKPEWIKLGEPLDTSGIEHRREALEDFARGTSLPVSTVVGGGVGDANHWSEWLASRKMFESGVGPTMDRICHLDLTRSFLWPRAVAAGVERSDLANWRIGYDPTPVLVKPDNSENALAAYRLGLADPDSTLDECGLSNAKALTDEQKAWLLAILSAGKTMETGAPVAVTTPAVSESNVSELPPAGDGVPMAAAVEPPPFVDTTDQDGGPSDAARKAALRKLTRLRQQLGTRLLAEAEHAYDAALRQAGMKVKTRARSRASSSRQAAVTRAVEAREPLRPLLAAIGMKEEELLRNAFDVLRDRAAAEFARYSERVAAVVEQTGADMRLPYEPEAAVDYLVACLSASVRARLLDGEQAVLAAAAPRMVPRARRAPSGGFDLPGLPDPDELSQAAARFTREAMRVHEGTATYTLPPTPDHLPTLVLTAEPSVEEQLAVELAVEPVWTWAHGFYGEPRTVFQPHADLDGYETTDRENNPDLVNLDAWPDGNVYAPADHDGCTCEWVPG